MQITSIPTTNNNIHILYTYYTELLYVLDDTHILSWCQREWMGMQLRTIKIRSLVRSNFNIFQQINLH